MNEIVNKYFYARDKFMPEMHLKQTFTIHLLKTEKEFRNSCKREI